MKLSRRGVIRKLCGVVQNGHSIAALNLARVAHLIHERMGLPPLAQGTLNVQLADPYIVQAEAEITANEYKDGETLKLQRCKVRGLRCCIMRPDTHQTPGNDGARVLEIMSEYRLRDHFGLANGDELKVEVEGDETWWNA